MQWKLTCATPIGELPVRTLENVFPDSKVAEAYSTSLDALWYHSLVEAHEAIKAAKSVLDAPVEFLLTPGPGSTLGWIANALLERAALRVINALTDPTSGALTLCSVRDQLLATCRPECRGELETELEAVFSETGSETLRDRAVRHRHTMLAHLTRGIFEKPGAWNKSRMALHELEALLDRACLMLNTLSFHTGRGYDLVRHSKDDSLAFIVEAVMRTSPLLNMPEAQGAIVFRAFAEHFTPAEREVFLGWRARLRLPAVELPPQPA